MQFYLSKQIKLIISFIGMFIILMIALDAFIIPDYSLNVFNKVRSFVGKPEVKVPVLSCVPFPLEGSTFVFDYEALNSEHNNYTNLKLVNHIKDKSTLVHLNSPDNLSRRIISVLIPAQGSVSVDVAKGKYKIKFEQGQRFCNVTRGFLFKQKDVTMSNLMDVNSMSHATFDIRDGGITNSGLKISLHENEDEMDLVSSSGDDSHLNVLKSPDGHFYIAAQGNGFPIVFLVDTGATNVALPMKYLKNMNIRKCTSVSSSTANGIVRGCGAIIKKIKLGSYTIHNVKATFLPKLNTPLLGMNVLNKFSMYQVDDVLQIIPKSRRVVRQR